jgi:hypothetical protein
LRPSPPRSYVAGWSNGDPKIVAEVGERVVKAARDLPDRLDVETSEPAVA